VIWLGLAPCRIEEVMRDEFQRQRLGRRPGQGASGRDQRPGLEIGEIGGERAQAVLAHAFPRQMFQGGDVVVGQDLGEPVAPVHRRDRREGVELEGAPRDGIARTGRGGRGHLASLARLKSRTSIAPSGRRLNRRIY
jgi:hypothetical protein